MHVVKTQASIFVSVYLHLSFDFIMKLLQHPAGCSSAFMLYNFLKVSRQKLTVVG